MRPASEFDPSIIINMHERRHVTGLLNVPSVEEVLGRRQHESSDDFVAIDSTGNPAGLLLLDRAHSWLCEMSRTESFSKCTNVTFARAGCTSISDLSKRARIATDFEIRKTAASKTCVRTAY
jgi:hypothetical protein